MVACACINLFLTGLIITKFIDLFKDEKESDASPCQELEKEEEDKILQFYQPSSLENKQGAWVRLIDMKKQLPPFLNLKKLISRLENLGFIVKRDKKGYKVLILNHETQKNEQV